MSGLPLLAAPSDGEELTVVSVSPGLPGFIAMFLLAAVVVLLVVDMTRRVRRVQADARVEARIAQQKIEEQQRADDQTAGDDPEAEGSLDSGDEADDAPEDHAPADDAPEDGNRPQG